MTERSKSTPGPWLKDENDDIYRLLDGDRDYIFSTTGQDEDRANALLAVEASNVHDETGLTPRELQKQRDELLALLLDLEGTPAIRMEISTSQRVRIDAAIAKVSA